MHFGEVWIFEFCELLVSRNFFPEDQQDMSFLKGSLFRGHVNFRGSTYRMWTGPDDHLTGADRELEDTFVSGKARVHLGLLHNISGKIIATLHDLTPKVAAKERKSPYFRKSRLVKYYTLARYLHMLWRFL